VRAVSRERERSIRPRYGPRPIDLFFKPEINSKFSETSEEDEDLIYRNQLAKAKAENETEY